jgi:serine/threonine protein kinase
VIHRDIKPANLLVDGSGSPKVIDYGVARATEAGVAEASQVTALGDLVGTVAYMSPEQFAARPDDIDVRTDVYSLGVVLHEMLSGRHPFDLRGLPVYEVARVVRESSPPALVDRCPRRHLDDGDRGLAAGGGGAAGPGAGRRGARVSGRLAAVSRSLA